MLNVIFGGFLYGLCIAIALRGNASTGGTDFIALYVSNKTGRSIWEYVFAGNVVILCIFGYMFGWLYAGYSILFQFISTKTISAFHHRYERVTLQITTAHAEEIMKAYIWKLSSRDFLCRCYWGIQPSENESASYSGLLL